MRGPCGFVLYSSVVMFAVFRQLAGMMFFARTNHSEKSASEGGDGAANGKTHAGAHPNGESSGGATKSSHRAAQTGVSPPKLRDKNFFKKKRIRP